MSSPRRNPEPARRSSTNDRDRGRNDKATAGPGGGGSADAEGEDRIGPYRIREEVGRGSFATVFRGTSVDTKDSVAIKAVIRSKLTTKLLENLESEISILKRITHRNIVELKDCLKTSSHIYLIMAFCSAGDLSLYIRKRGDLVALTASNQGLLPDPIKSKEAELRPVLYPHPKDGGLNETIVRCFLGQLVDALRFLRTQNVIHRDIKPQNLLLQPASASDLAAGHPPGIPVLKVADFGFARWLPSQSLAETLCGSPLYMAPEILRYEKYDAKADLWSVGAVLFEMSVGKPPFRAQNHVDLLRKIERGEDKIKFPDEKKHDETTDKVPTRVAPDLKALIRALLKRNPGERMSFDDFFRDASRVATGGTAVGLMSAESVSAEYARIASLSNVITTSRTPSSSTPPPPLNPPPPPIPSYIDQEPPPFARRPSQATPPLPAPSPASGSGSSRTSSFAPKYVVAGSGSNAADADIKVRDFVVPRASTSNDVPVNRVGSAMDRLADQTREADSMTESSDSVLGRDYVVVEKRTVEINALADELANAPKQSNLVVQRTGRGFLSRPLSSLGTTPPTTLAPVAPYPPVLSPYDSNTTPPFAIPAQRQVSAPHPYSLASSPRPPSFLSSSPRSATFIERFPGSPLALVGSPTAAIAKGLLNMASLKIFGSPTDGILLRRASTRKPISRSTPVVDPEEDKLMSELEEIAQKALVIFDFADSKIIHILPPTPQTSSSTSLGTPSYFSHLAAREQASMNPFSPIPTSSSPMRRTSSSSCERPFGIPPSTVKAEVIAAESMVLYLKSLAFLGKGIEKARKFWNGRKTDQAPSPDFNEAVQWFRQRFNECFDKAEFAKSRSLDSIPSSALTSKLIYDRALEISRASALLELSNTSPADCETAYETALWMLYSILDPLLDDGDGAMDETDRGTVERFVASVEGRLKALRKK